MLEGKFDGDVVSGEEADEGGGVARGEGRGGEADVGFGWGGGEDLDPLGGADGVNPLTGKFVLGEAEGFAVEAGGGGGVGGVEAGEGDAGDGGAGGGPGLGGGCCRLG